MIGTRVSTSRRDEDYFDNSQPAQLYLCTLKSIGGRQSANIMPLLGREQTTLPYDTLYKLANNVPLGSRFSL